MSVVTVTVLSDGRAIDEQYALMSIIVRRELNRVPSATLVFSDGDMADGSFPVSDSGLFDPGKKVQISARYEGDDTGDAVLFKGLVVRHAIEATARGSLLRVELRHEVIKMTRPRRSQVLEAMTDSALMQRLLRDAGLRAKVDTTPGQHESLVQYDCSDWDFLLSRAEANGLVVAVADEQVQVVQPQADGASVVSVVYGDNVIEIEFETDALGQDASFKARSWDAKQQAEQVSVGQAAGAPGQGTLTGSEAARAVGFGEAVLVHPVVLKADETKAWADSESQRAQLSLVRGHVCIQGQGKLALLQHADIKNVAKCFLGKALITGLCHRIEDGNWTVDLQFGLSGQAHSRRADIAAPAAAGLWPAVSGLQIGVVTQGDNDPLGEYRVKVMLPALGDGAPAVWARLARPDAGKDRGWYARPEPGDEVVLGFFNQDPRQPVLLGSLFSSKYPPPASVFDASAKNLLGGLASRSGLTLGFRDGDKPQLLLQTPGGAKLLMDDDAKAITLSDSHGNKLTLDENGITVVSGKAFKVDASGNAEIKGAKVDLK